MSLGFLLFLFIGIPVVDAVLSAFCSTKTEPLTMHKQALITLRHDAALAEMRNDEAQRELVRAKQYAERTAREYEEAKRRLYAAKDAA